MRGIGRRRVTHTLHVLDRKRSVRVSLPSNCATRARHGDDAGLPVPTRRLLGASRRCRVGRLGWAACGWGDSCDGGGALAPALPPWTPARDQRDQHRRGRDTDTVRRECGGGGGGRRRPGDIAIVRRPPSAGRWRVSDAPARLRYARGVCSGAMHTPCARHAHAVHTPCAQRTLCTCHAARRVRAGARGGNIGNGPELSSWRPDDLVDHTRAAREAGRMRCVCGRAVSRGGDGASAGRCTARARRRPLPVRLAPHPPRRPAGSLTRGAVGQHGPSVVL